MFFYICGDLKKVKRRKIPWGRKGRNDFIFQERVSLWREVGACMPVIMGCLLGHEPPFHYKKKKQKKKRGKK